MAYGIVRLTLYALLTAVEADLRDLISINLLGNQEPQHLLPSKTYERARERMESESGFNAASGSTILDYLDFAESIELLSSNNQKLSGPLQKAVRLISTNASMITPIRNRVMHSRPLEFDDFARVSDLCRQLLSFPVYLFPKLRQTEEFIKTDPRYVFSLNLEELRSPSARITHNLPIPDFDETGFLGRTEESAQLIRIAKSSPWPVVTVLGEGGVGKTALALKVAYEMLDDQDAGFDAVVWTSSKTTRLTVKDIQNIDGAIQTSLGVFQDIARGLNEETATIDVILKYLNTFKILLIMDNLETILDTAVRDFLAQITSQSKVLITSRVGLGELEYRFPLRAMKDEEAVSLLRATAQVRRVEQLVRTSNTDLKIYCRKMKNNALFIKWFVSSVQSGRRPEETLQNSSILLEYCLSNVVEHLSDDARLLARAMVGIPGPHAQPVLAYLTDLDGERLQLALQQLVTANVAVLTAQPTSSGYESLYDLGNLPKLYLLKSLPPSAEEMAAFGKRHSDLAMAHEQIRARATASPYSPNSVAIRTKDDVVVAKYLTDALYAVWQKRFEQADTLVERAKGISPNYSEIYRVEGWYQYFAGNFAAARNAYETAIELNPHSPYIRYWYAGFLLRAQRDTEAAVKQLAVARELDPNSAEVRVEYARGLAFLFRFDQADEELRPVIEGAHVTKLMRVAYDGWMQIAVRRGYFAVDSNDYLSALSAFQNAVQRFHSIPGEYRDRRIIESILHCLPVARRTLDELFHSDRAEAAEKLIARIEAIGSSIAADDPLGTPHTGAPPMHLKFGETGLGEISYVNTVSKFGFIRVDGGGDLFFHQNHLKPPVPIRYRSLGERVRFVVGENQHGLTAEKVEILTPDKEPKTLGNQMFGVVDRIFPEKSFGFIRSDDGMEIFFHRTELMTQGQNISRLPPGTRVRFILSRNDKGLIAKSIERSLEQLHNLIEVGQRVTGKVRARRRGTSYAFVDIGADRDVLIRSQDFREPGEWERVVDGDVVSFTVTQGKERENYNSVDIIVEHKF